MHLKSVIIKVIFVFAKTVSAPVLPPLPKTVESCGENKYNNLEKVIPCSFVTSAQKKHGP